MADLPSRVEWQDTTLGELLVFDISLVLTSILMSLFFFFGGKYIAIYLGQFFDWVLYEALGVTGVIIFQIIIILVYAIAITLAIIYALYGGINLLIIRFLKAEKIPHFRDTCKFQTYCYARSKWNVRVNNILFFGAMIVGAVIGTIIPNYYSFLTPSTSGIVIWLIFAILVFGLPIYRFFVIISDVSFFAYRDPDFSMRKNMYLVFIIALAILSGLFIAFIMWQNIILDFKYALSLIYILFYCIIVALLIPLIIFIIKYIKLPK